MSISEKLNPPCFLRNLKMLFVWSFLASSSGVVCHLQNQLLQPFTNSLFAKKRLPVLPVNGVDVDFALHHQKHHRVKLFCNFKKLDKSSKIIVNFPTSANSQMKCGSAVVICPVEINPVCVVSVQLAHRSPYCRKQQ